MSQYAWDGLSSDCCMVGTRFVHLSLTFSEKWGPLTDCLLHIHTMKQNGWEVLLALREVAWHRSCPRCSVLSQCKPGNIPWSVLCCKPCFNIAWDSINTPGTKPAQTWPEPRLQACLIGCRYLLLQVWAKSLPQEPLLSSWILHWLKNTHLCSEFT